MIRLGRLGLLLGLLRLDIRMDQLTPSPIVAS